MAQLLITWDAEPGDGAKEGGEECMVDRIATFVIDNFGSRDNLSISGDLSGRGLWVLAAEGARVVTEQREARRDRK